MTSFNDEWEKKLQDSSGMPIPLPLQFLKAITCDFSTELVLGRGGYGVVYKGVLPSGKIIAVKKIIDAHLVDDEIFKKEVNSVMEIKHQHVVQFIGYCAESSYENIKQPNGNFIWAEIPKRLLCFEYLCNESLRKYISAPIYESLVLDWNMRYEIIRGICDGLNFLHAEFLMVHLDLKPENILMDATMLPKIADFGLSRIFGKEQSRILTNNRFGSRGYMAPEYLIQGIITMKADIFSLGVIIIEIITGSRDYPYFQFYSPESTATSCQHFTEEVLGSWRCIFESTVKYIPIEKYNQQVKNCIAIALKCVDPCMEKRPAVKDVIQVINAVDQMEVSKELRSELQSLVLDSTVKKELRFGMTENMSNTETDDKMGDMKKSQECLSPTPLCKSRTGIENHQEAANESGEERRSIDKSSEIEAQGDLKCTNKFMVPNTTTNKDLASQSVTGEMFVYKKYDKSLSPMPTLWESSPCNQNYQEGAQASSDPQSSLDTTMETKVEWAVQYEPGVYVTLTERLDGTRELKRIKFSRIRFPNDASERWWNENRDKVYERYDVRLHRGSIVGRIS